MRKDVHVHIDYDIVDQLEEIKKKNHITLSNAYNNILELGLNFYLIDENVKTITKNVTSCNKSLRYLINLSEQIYSDLNLSMVDPSKSDNLKKFKRRNKYNKED